MTLPILCILQNQNRLSNVTLSTPVVPLATPSVVGMQSAFPVNESGEYEYHPKYHSVK